MKKVQDDYILNFSNNDNGNLYYAKLIKVHRDLSWDLVVYFPNGVIAPQLLRQRKCINKNRFFNSNSYTKTRVYNSDLDYSIPMLIPHQRQVLHHFILNLVIGN